MPMVGSDAIIPYPIWNKYSVGCKARKKGWKCQNYIRELPCCCESHGHTYEIVYKLKF